MRNQTCELCAVMFADTIETDCGHEAYLCTPCLNAIHNSGDDLLCIECEEKRR